MTTIASLRGRVGSWWRALRPVHLPVRPVHDPDALTMSQSDYWHRLGRFVGS